MEKSKRNSAESALLSSIAHRFCALGEVGSWTKDPTVYTVNTVLEF